MTDIELMPDGRIFVFGTSREVLEVLNRLRTKQDELLAARRHLGSADGPRSVEPQQPDTIS